MYVDVVARLWFAHLYILFVLFTCRFQHVYGSKREQVYSIKYLKV